MEKEEKTYTFDSTADTQTAFDLLLGAVTKLKKTHYQGAEFSVPTGSKVNIFTYGTRIEVTLALGPGITTPSQIIRSVMSDIDVCLSGLAN